MCYWHINVIKHFDVNIKILIITHPTRNSSTILQIRFNKGYVWYVATL